MRQVHEYPSLKTIHVETFTLTLDVPYVAGFLGFREVPSSMTTCQRGAVTHRQ